MDCGCFPAHQTMHTKDDRCGQGRPSGSRQRRLAFPKQRHRIVQCDSPWPCHTSCLAVGAANPSRTTRSPDCLQRPLLRRSRFQRRLTPGVLAPRTLGVSCRVNVPGGYGLATHPDRGWRPWRSRGLPRRTRGATRRQRILSAVGVTAPPAGLGQLRNTRVADAAGVHAHRRPHQRRRIGEEAKVRRRPQAAAGRKRDVEARGRPPRLRRVERVGDW